MNRVTCTTCFGCCPGHMLATNDSKLTVPQKLTMGSNKGCLTLHTNPHDGKNLHPSGVLNTSSRNSRPPSLPPSLSGASSLLVLSPPPLPPGRPAAGSPYRLVLPPSSLSLALSQGESRHFSPSPRLTPGRAVAGLPGRLSPGQRPPSPWLRPRVLPPSPSPH